MKYVGHINIGNNQAGKGDGYRPKSKCPNEKLFFTLKQVKEFESKHKGMHCYLCKRRIHISRTFLLYGKKLVVCDKCEKGVYM